MDLKVRVLGDVGQFDAAMRQASGSASGFKNALGSAISIGAVVAYVDSITAAAERIQDTSQALGVQSDTLQAVEYAARHAGSGADEMRAIFGILSQKQGEVIRGSKDTVAQFEALGLSASAVAGMTLDQLFDAVAQAIGKGADRATTMAAAVDLLGRQARGAMGALREIGQIGLPDLVNQARDKGQIVEQDDLDRIARARDNIEDLKTQVGNFITAGIGESIQMFKDLGAGLNGVIDGKGFWRGYDANYVLGTDQRPEPPSPEQIAADMEARRVAGVTTENAKLEKLYQEVERGLQKFTLSEEGVLALRRNELAAIQKRGAEEAAKFAAEGKLQDARNAQLKANIESAKVAGEIYQLEDSIKEKAKRATEDQARETRDLDKIRRGEGIRVSAPEAADQLARFGAYVGAQSNPNRTIHERQVQIQEKIEQHTREMAEKKGGVLP